MILIHDVKPWMLKIDLPFDTITFDDALYSQWYYADHFLAMKKRLIVFVSTGIIHTGDNQVVDISCRDAHKRFFATGDTRPYMTKDQILDLSNRGFEIGLHGVTHSHMPKGLKGMQMAMDEALQSYETLKSWGLNPKTMSYPYNEPNTGFKILDRYGFKYFGAERITIERFRCDTLSREITAKKNLMIAKFQTQSKKH